MNHIKQINDTINALIWTKIGVWLLIATGIVLTILTGFFQIKDFRQWVNKTAGSLFDKHITNHEETKKAISQFQSLCVALAGTVGVGNIAGVSSAILIGGPGAVFWMWVAAFFGVMTKYAENVLGVYYRRKNAEGEWCGGPMYYLRDGFSVHGRGKKAGAVLAAVFAVCAILASFGIGNMGQINKIAVAVTQAIDIHSLSSVVLYTSGEKPVTLYMLLIGVVMMVCVGVVVFGGIQRIAKVAEKLVPFMIIMYMISTIIVICAHISQVGSAFGHIFEMAITKRAVWGGTTGVAFGTIITQGCKRGIFSNEAGLGSSVMVHSNSNVKEPVRQGLWGIFEVFMDTFIVCTLTALAILTSGAVDLDTGLTSSTEATLVADAFNTVFQVGNVKLGGIFIMFFTLLFAYTTVLGWSHYGTKAVEYLSGRHAAVFTKLYRGIFVLMVLSGALMTSSLAWDISDTFNGMMMIPNLIGIITLSPLVVRLTRNYMERRSMEKEKPPMLSFDKEIQADGARSMKEDGKE